MIFNQTIGVIGSVKVNTYPSLCFTPREILNYFFFQVKEAQLSYNLLEYNRRFYHDWLQIRPKILKPTNEIRRKNWHSLPKETNAMSVLKLFLCVHVKEALYENELD